MDINTLLNELSQEPESGIHLSQQTEIEEKRLRFVNELKARLEGKKGLRLWIETFRLFPEVYRYYRNLKQ